MKELQKLVAGAVAERGYRDGWTDEQFAARQIAKAVEELDELAQAIRFRGFPLDWLGYLNEAGFVAMGAFDEAGAWQEVESINLEVAASEIADVAIPLLAFAETLGIDLERAIRAKVTGDIARGVRGEKLGVQWTRLAELRAGAVFETQDGVKAVKCLIPLGYTGLKERCILLLTGKTDFIDAHILVREIVL